MKWIIKSMLFLGSIPLAWLYLYSLDILPRPERFDQLLTFGLCLTFGGLFVAFIWYGPMNEGKFQ